MPLEMMPMSIGTIPNLVAASVVANCITSILLQIYAAKDIQTYSSKSGDSSPT
jgi:sulfite exporter TauE/SafE